jgi:hypothetical protein
MRSAAALAALLSSSACAGPATQPEPPPSCSAFAQAIDLSDRIKTLDLLSDAFFQKCYATVIVYGTQAQAEFRHKTFHVFKEAATVFIPDGTLTDYVLESYERGFLSILLASSYEHMQKLDDAKVELRRMDHELFAPLYNFGEDPVNLLLSAILWERLGEPNEARVDWHRLRDPATGLRGVDDSLRAFADRQVRRIDEGRSPGPAWRLFWLGRFPDIDWDLQFTGSSNGYFAVRAREAFPSTCVSDTGVRLSTQSWFEKIAVRHSNAYHPLLNIQSWIRLPMGVLYSLVPVAAGAGIVVGGCTLDAAGKGKGALCEVAIRGGVVFISMAPKVLRGALEPDLRHWSHIPAAFVVTSAADKAREGCYYPAG